MQAAVQITNALHDILHLVLVLGLDLAGLANDEIQVELDGTLGAGQPAAGGIGVGREADAVLAGVGSGKGEAARVVLALGHDAVVIVEGLLDSDLHLQAVVDRVGVGLRIDDLSFELSCSFQDSSVSPESISRESQMNELQLP